MGLFSIISVISISLQPFESAHKEKICRQWEIISLFSKEKKIKSRLKQRSISGAQENGRFKYFAEIYCYSSGKIDSKTTILLHLHCSLSNLDI